MIEKNNINTAKEIYFKYSGSKFQMMRDGILKEYESFNISKGEENEWLKELIGNEFKKLDINSIESFFPLWYILQHHGVFNCFNQLESFIKSNSTDSSSREKALSFIDKTISVLNEMGPDKIKLTISEIKRFNKLRLEIISQI